MAVFIQAGLIKMLEVASQLLPPLPGDLLALIVALPVLFTPGQVSPPATQHHLLLYKE